MLISIIIPFYNASSYLAGNLTLLASQRYQELEFILVDDGSHDESERIAQEFVQQDSRFKLFKQTANQGQGPARNLGLRVARGEYVWFIDADDHIASADSVQSIVKALGDQRPNVVEFRFEVAQVVQQSANQQLIHYRYHPSSLASGSYATKEVLGQVMQPAFHHKSDYLNFALWTNWYRRSFLEAIGAQQLANTKHQDNISILWLAASDEVFFINEKHYRYFLHPHNSSAKRNPTNYYQDMLRLSDQWIAFYEQHLKHSSQQSESLALLYLLHAFNFLVFNAHAHYVQQLSKAQQSQVIASYWQRLQTVIVSYPLEDSQALLSSGKLFGMSYNVKAMQCLWQALSAGTVISQRKQRKLWLAVVPKSGLQARVIVKACLPYAVVRWLQATHQASSVKAIVNSCLPYAFSQRSKR